MTTWKLKNPPIWEAGIGAALQPATLYDQYEVAEVHRLFSNEFPLAQRQPHLEPLSEFTVDVQNGVSFVQIQGAPPVRWWFTSSDSRNLVQIQEDFIGRNWRRTDWAPATKESYPGFDVLLADFLNAVKDLRQFNSARSRPFPKPKLFDVVYVNHLLARREDGTVMKYREIFPWLQFPDAIPKGAFSIGWLEHQEAFSSQFSAQFVGMQTEDGAEIMPVMRFVLNARGPCEAWEDYEAKCLQAHNELRSRFVALTSPELHAIWSR